MEARFGECALDTASRQLFRRDEPVHLSAKAFELLSLLLASRPRAISKSELLQRVWPSTFVAEANLSNLVAEIRAAVGDDPRGPRFIRTVHGFGYAFCGDAAETHQQAGPLEQPLDTYCWLVSGEKKVPLSKGEHLIGRHPASVMPIGSLHASRHHCLITVGPAGSILTDLGSRNGTYVGGERILAPRVLRDGDAIRVGSTVLVYSVASSGPPTEVDLPPASS